MGNSSSCFKSQFGKAKLFDLDQDLIFLIDTPITAAELMIEEPNCVVSRLTDLNYDRRICAMKDDEVLTAGGVYVLIPVARVGGEILPIEMAAIEFACGKRGSNQKHGSKVLPVAVEIPTEDREELKSSRGVKIVKQWRKQWKPALDTIYEGTYYNSNL